MSQQDGGVATPLANPKPPANSKYAGEVTVAGYSIRITCHGEIEIVNRDNDGFFIETVRLVPPPIPGWKDSLDAAVKDLQDERHNVRPLGYYLPIGSVVTYKPNGQNLGQIPTGVGIADDVIGGDLERVIAAVELWLKRTLEE